jgi:hypothetical protein
VHPYRELPRPGPERRPDEELAIYALLVVIGAIPVSVAALGSGGFGVHAVLGLVMMLLGANGLRRWYRGGGADVHKRR